MALSLISSASWEFWKSWKEWRAFLCFFIDIIFRILGIFLKSECKFNACSCSLIAADYSLPGAFVDGRVQNMPLLHVKSNCYNIITFIMRMVISCWKLLLKSNLLYFIWIVLLCRMCLHITNNILPTFTICFYINLFSDLESWNIGNFGKIFVDYFGL